MSYYCVFQLDWKLPETNTSFVDTLKELNIEIPDDVQIRQGTKTLGFNIVEQIEKIENLSYAIQGEQCSWRTQDEDMRTLSEKFPNVLFILDTQAAEDTYDEWREFWRNGKYYTVQPVKVYPEFDESKLK